MKMNRKQFTYCLLESIERSPLSNPFEDLYIVDAKDASNHFFWETDGFDKHDLFENLVRMKILKSYIEPEIVYNCNTDDGIDYGYKLSDPNHLFFYFIKGKKFYLYLKSLRKELLSGKNNIEELKIPDNKEIGLELSFDDFSGQIKINGKNLKKPHPGEVNFIVFEYLFNRPNKKVDKKTLNDLVLRETNLELKKPLRSIATELGFTGKRRELFFQTSEKTARLRTKITKEKIEKDKINISEILP